ncbi:hypothetical protein THIOKS11330005 [Thiocapsa sp. KS1]|nr:hypothetical protein [Thiocapsa sp. KS1]CRI63482.1 hypothetical protein THIOKS11330005 [Thiocapsa sp. KS1]
MTRPDSFHAPMASSASPSKRDQAISAFGPQTTYRDSQGLGIASAAAALEYDIDDGLLQIRIDGPLDLRCAFALLRIGQTVDESIGACTLDLTGVDRIFDSGIAALALVLRELKRNGVGRIRIHGLERGSVILQPYLM